VWVRNKRNKRVVVAVGWTALTAWQVIQATGNVEAFRKMYSSTSQCYVKFTVSPQACRKCADNICVQSQLKVQVI